MTDYIITQSHVRFTPKDPKLEDIYIEDIAHALSLLCRANGHFPEFFSVAQHCLVCAEEANARGYAVNVQLACLLHDGSEAYLSDITRPVKQYLTTYQEIEKRLEEAVYQRFLTKPLTDEERTQVKSVDDDTLYHEFYHFTGETLYEEVPVLFSTPLFLERDHREVEQEYLEKYKKLDACLKKKS